MPLTLLPNQEFVIRGSCKDLVYYMEMKETEYMGAALESGVAKKLRNTHLIFFFHLQQKTQDNSMIKPSWPFSVSKRGKAALDEDLENLVGPKVQRPDYWLEFSFGSPMLPVHPSGSWVRMAP